MELVRQTLEQLLGLMQLDLNATILTRQDELHINVTGRDRAYLITDNGETLLSLQYIVAKMIRQKLPELNQAQVVVDSDGYMYRHEQAVKRMALRAADRVRNQRSRIKLPPLNPYDRRIVHLEIGRDQSLDSLSEGEGFLKKIVVKRK
jgi:spoIIIJ-associated protein